MRVCVCVSAYVYIYIYVCLCVCVCECVCVYVCVCVCYICAQSCVTGQLNSLKLIDKDSVVSNRMADATFLSSSVLTFISKVKVIK